MRCSRTYKCFREMQVGLVNGWITIQSLGSYAAKPALFGFLYGTIYTLFTWHEKQIKEVSMEPKTFIVIYILLLVTTIVLVVMKRTHWFSIIGVALMPIYFIWVLLDACRPSDAKRPKQDAPDELSKDETMKGNKMNTDIRKQVIHEYENDNDHRFSAADFSNADLSGCGLSGAKFVGKIMRSTNLSRSALAFASSFESDLTGANLSWAVLTDAFLKDVNLSNANLASANLFRANLTGANLTGANLNLADLGQATMPDGKKYSSGMDISKYGATGTPMDL